MGEWLESLVPWGTETLVTVQSYSSELLVVIFTAFTLLGNEEFYLILLPIVYWCIDKRIGVALGYVSLLSAWTNNMFKYLLAIPRPSDPRLDTPRPETSPSFPSGHAQGAVVNWGYLAFRFRNRIFWIVSIVMILGISLSRMVLGVHFPQDVIGGWLIGLILAVVFAWASPPVGRWVERQVVPVQLTLTIAFPLVLIFVHPTDTAGHYPAEAAITTMSALLGFGVGLIMERSMVHFQVDGEWGQKSLRFLLGIVIIALLYFGPKLILPENMAYGLEAALRFVRYSLVGWAVAFLCPWFFVRLRLAQQAES